MRKKRDVGVRKKQLRDLAAHVPVIVVNVLFENRTLMVMNKMSPDEAFYNAHIKSDGVTISDAVDGDRLMLQVALNIYHKLYANTKITAFKMTPEEFQHNSDGLWEVREPKMNSKLRETMQKIRENETQNSKREFSANNQT